MRVRVRGRADDKGARLTELAAFLYAESGRYWFFTQSILNRLAEDRARAYQDHEVDDKIVEMLAAHAKTQGSFSRVSPPIRDPTTIDEAPNLALVILGPAFPHSGVGGPEPGHRHGDRRVHPMSRVAAQIPQDQNERQEAERGRHPSLSLPFLCCCKFSGL
jgi:hypothetical protein